MTDTTIYPVTPLFSRFPIYAPTSTLPALCTPPSPPGSANPEWGDVDVGAVATTWHGTYPYLDTLDESGSYGEAPGQNWPLSWDIGGGIWPDSPQPYPTSIVGRLPATAAPPGVTGARFEREVYVDMALDVDGLVGVTFSIDSQAGYFYYMTPPDTRQAAATWVTLSADLIFSDPSLGDGQDLTSFLAVLAAGELDLSVGASGLPGFRTADLFRVSMIRLVLTGGAVPLRQVQRDDGWGRSVMRARSTHSVQKSIRQRGYR